jgi:hypothetical protein
VLELIEAVAFSKRGVELAQVLDVGELLVELAQRLGGRETPASMGHLFMRNRNHSVIVLLCRKNGSIEDYRPRVS